MIKAKNLSDEHLAVLFSFSKSLRFWLPFSLVVYAVATGLKITLPMLLLNGLIAFLTICLGHCVGLHRYVVHQSFEAPPFMKPVFLLLAALCGFGGPLGWIEFHALRDYWQCEPIAPKAIKYQNGMWTDFFFTLHCKVEPTSDVHLNMLPPGLLKDKWVLFFERHWLSMNLVVAGVIWWVWSFDMMVYFVALRASVGLFMHWLVAYIVHVWGHKEYQIAGASEEGRNHLILGWLTFGEAFHNNHHRFPGSASAGLKKVEFDLGYKVIKALELVGLAHNVKLSEDHYSHR